MKSSKEAEMVKNGQIHFNVETETLAYLKEQAEKEGISLSEYCRKQTLKGSQLDRIEFMVKEIHKIIVEG